MRVESCVAPVALQARLGSAPHLATLASGSCQEGINVWQQACLDHHFRHLRLPHNQVG